MTTDPRDDEIARRFEERRLADEAAATDLEALLARPPRRHAVQAWAIRRLAFVAAALAAAASAVFVLRNVRPWHGGAPESSDLPPAAMELAAWKAPTDTLLQTPGTDLWTSVPDLAPDASVLETGIPLASTKGVER
jgi:hypothetical protein